MMKAAPMPLTIRPPSDADRADWDRLYQGYAEFYKVTQTPEMRDTVWSWIMDPAQTTEALIAVNAAGRPVGLAHFRPYARPLSASTGGFLDDLFVDPDARGGRVAARLITALRELACQRGWSVLRWITADDNYRARALYDQLAIKTSWVTYDIKP
jgi:GNAT superfamily N-acetyltransferase